MTNYVLVPGQTVTVEVVENEVVVQVQTVSNTPSVEIALPVDQGVPGAQGVQGSQGLQGVQGSGGTQGTAGVLGSLGIQGPAGAQGITGSGAQGASGSQGAQGLQGTQGIQGITGSQGAQGIQGIQGTQGSQGAQGSQGSQGTQGTQGTQGNQGLTGVGAQGIQGNSGVSGYSSGILGIWRVSNNAPPPTAGSHDLIYSNFVAQTSSTTLYFDHIELGGLDVETFLGLIQPNDTILVQDSNVSQNYQKFTVNSAVTQVAGNYISIPVTFVSSSGSGTTGFANNHQILLYVSSIGPTGAQGTQGIQGITGIQGTQGLLGIQGFTGAGTQGIQGTTGSGGGGGSFTLLETEVNLSSSPRRNGNFDVVGAGMTIGKPVMMYQAVGPYTGKGTLADEAEMDQVLVAASVTSATNIKAYWTSNYDVRGNIKFNYIIGA